MKNSILIVALAATVFAGPRPAPPLPVAFASWYDRFDGMWTFEFPTEGGNYYYLEVQTPPSTNWLVQVNAYFGPTLDENYQTNVLTTNRFNWVPESSIEFYRMVRIPN